DPAKDPKCVGGRERPTAWPVAECRRGRRWRSNGRVGTKDCSFAPLTEPDMRASHPALWIDISELQHELGRNQRWVETFPHRFERGHPSVEPCRRIGLLHRGAVRF